MHDLWLVGCFLNPLLKDMDFLPDPATKLEYRMRAEALIRNLCGIIPGNTIESQIFINENAQISSSVSVRLKQTKFNMLNFVDSLSTSSVIMDEVDRYKSLKAGQLGLDPASLISGSFSVMNFWFECKKMFPMLYKVSLRVFAPPVSSSSSERVFSALKNLVSAERCRLCTWSIQDIIVARSLM